MLAEWLKASKYTVIFTGAGMSTESGVPDFRSSTGLWKYNPQQLASTQAMQHLVQSIITQNTDGLHEMSCDLPVYPIHGTIRQLHCQTCKKVYSVERYFQNDLYCSCGGFVRPSVVLFGESLDADLLEASAQEAEKADLFIVLGSSLVVSPANSFPLIAKEHGAKLVIINHDPTPLDAHADLVMNRRKIGEVLSEVNEQLMIE